MKTIFKPLSALLIILITAKAKSQENSSPQNFPEAFAGIECNSLTGLSYERYIFQKEKWVAWLEGFSCIYLQVRECLLIWNQWARISFF